MTEREARVVRLLRAVVATLVVIGLGASAHQAGGGPSPQVIPLLVLAVVVGPLVWVIVRSHASVPRMVLATALGQVVTHVLLAGMSSTTIGTATGPHVHELLSAQLTAPSPTMTSHSSWSMLVAHAVATGLAAMILTAGDDVARAATQRLLTPPWPTITVTVGHLALPVEPALGSLAAREMRPVGGRAPPLHPC